MKKMLLHFQNCSAHRRPVRALVVGLIIVGCSSALAQSFTDSATINVIGAIGDSACVITTSPVDMGAHDASEFTGVGTSPNSGWVDFPITSAGCSADIVTLHLGFDGTADATNSGLFALSPGGATGIGIQLQAQDGSATVVPNSTTELLNWAPVAVGATYSMRARYLQTLVSVTPGAANSVVTVLMSYN